MGNLMEQLDKARYVRYDRERELTLAWFGGHGIHAYDAEGHEVAFWNIGNFESSGITLHEAEKEIDDQLRTGSYAED